MKEKSPKRLDKDIYHDISVLTGIGPSTIKHVKQAALKGLYTAFSTSGKTRPNARGKRKRIAKLTPFQINAYRRHVHAFFFRNEPPTVKNLLPIIDADETLPDRGRTTIYKTLRDLGFVFKKWNRSSILIERDDIKVWRCRFLRAMKKYRQSDRAIYYLDETWFNLGHLGAEDLGNPQLAAVDDGYPTEFRPPTGQEGCLIAAHVGCEEGFLDGSLFIFQAKKVKGYYPNEMDEITFEKWFLAILPKLKPNSIIVLDNAQCHSAVMDKMPAKGWKKSDIQLWLRDKGVEFTSDMVIAELLKLAKGVKHKYHAYRIDILAAERGHTVIRLPPYHLEFNPMEMIWAQVKAYVEANTKTYEQAEVEMHLREGVRCITPENWKLCIEHVTKEEERFWEHDHLTDAMVVPSGEDAEHEETCSLEGSVYDGMSGIDDSGDDIDFD